MEETLFSSYYDLQISFNHKRIKMLDFSGVDSHSHDVFEFIYLNKGSLTYIIDEKTFKVEEDSLIITRPGNLHMINFDDSLIYDRHNIIFEEGIVFPEIYERLAKCPDVISCKNHPQIGELFRKADFYCSHFSGDALKNVLSHLIDEIAYNAVILNGNDSEETACDTNPLFARVIEYIDNNLTKDFTLETLCSELYISKSQLNNIFREHLNITPKKYVALKRLNYAQKMLQQGYGATKVFEQCGFFDYSAFYRSYKNHFGYSPSEELTRHTIRNIMC